MRPLLSKAAKISLNNAVFVYGSLMAPQVVEELVGRLPLSIPAVKLRGYKRHPVKEQVYPAIIPSPKQNDNVEGMIWHALTDWELQAFDWFEDDEYHRTKVQVTVDRQLVRQLLDATFKNDDDNLCQNDEESDAALIEIDAYIWANPHSQLELDQEWSFDYFCANHLEWYLTNTVKRYRVELEKLKRESSS